MGIWKRGKQDGGLDWGLYRCFSLPVRLWIPGCDASWAVGGRRPGGGRVMGDY